MPRTSILTEPGEIISAVVASCGLHAHHVMDDTDAIQIVRLLNHKAPNIRRRAIKILFRFGTIEMLAFVVPLLNDKSSFVAIEACKVLGLRKMTDYIENVNKIMLSKKLSIRTAAATTLAQMGEQNGIDVLMTLACSRGKHQPVAVKAFGLIVGQKFYCTPRGIKDMQNWIKHRKRYHDIRP
jgi:hypothetical protein